MKVGENIRLKGYGDKELVRRIVELRKRTVVVCREEEYQRAVLEKRQPLCVGFNTRFVIGE